MRWLVWRQHRIEIIVLLAGAVCIAAALLYGADLAARLRTDLGADSCQPGPFTNASCVTLEARVGEQLQPFRWLLIALLFVPAVVGSFVGGPLFARDLERGTHRLVWTQGVTRLRWGAAKLATILIVAALAAALVGSVGGLATTIVGGWWMASASQASAGPFRVFDYQAPALVGQVVFAIAVAAFVGTLSRRILTGMFVGLLLFGLVRIVVQWELRPIYEPPVTVIFRPEEQTSGWQRIAVGAPDGAWFLGADHVDRGGRRVPGERVASLLRVYRPAGPGFDPAAYLAEYDVYQRIRYQPADRYWRFQWTEALLYFALSGALCAGTLLLLRRRDA